VGDAVGLADADHPAGELVTASELVSLGAAQAQGGGRGHQVDRCGGAQLGDGDGGHRVRFLPRGGVVQLAGMSAGRVAATTCGQVEWVDLDVLAGLRGLDDLARRPGTSRHGRDRRPVPSEPAEKQQVPGLDLGQRNLRGRPGATGKWSARSGCPQPRRRHTPGPSSQRRLAQPRPTGKAYRAGPARTRPPPPPR